MEAAQPRDRKKGSSPAQSQEEGKLTSSETGIKGTAWSRDR